MHRPLFSHSLTYSTHSQLTTLLYLALAVLPFPFLPFPSLILWDNRYIPRDQISCLIIIIIIIVAVVVIVVVVTSGARARAWYLHVPTYLGR